MAEPTSAKYASIPKPQMRTIRSAALTALLIVSVSCATRPEGFQSHLDGGRCEEAAAEIPDEHEIGQILANRTIEVGGTVASYAYTGLGYTSEAVLDVAGSLTMAMFLCWPGILISTSNSPMIGSRTVCLPGKMDHLFAPALGREAYRSTEPLRCPRLQHLSESVRRVATCFKNQDTAEARDRAWQTLTSLQHRSDFYRCLPPAETAAIDRELQLLAQSN